MAAATSGTVAARTASSAMAAVGLPVIVERPVPRIGMRRDQPPPELDARAFFRYGVDLTGNGNDVRIFLNVGLCVYREVRKCKKQ